MAYNEQMAQRIRQVLDDKGVGFYEKNMFGGVCFMVDNKMCAATHTDKKTGEDVVLCRVGDAAYENALEQNYVIPMEFTGKPMKGYVYVTEGGMGTYKELAYWLQLCIDYNPLAKKSK